MDFRSEEDDNQRLDSLRMLGGEAEELEANHLKLNLPYPAADQSW